MQVLDSCEKCIFLCQCFNEEAAGNETSCKQISGFFSFALLVVIQSLCFVDIRSTSCNTFRQTNLLLALFQNFKNGKQATSSMVKRQHIVTKKIKPLKLSERLQGNLVSTMFIIKDIAIIMTILFYILIWDVSSFIKISSDSAITHWDWCDMQKKKV